MGCGFGERFFNITCCDKVCNEEVLRRVGEERAIISVINRSRSLTEDRESGLVKPYDVVIMSH